MKRRSVLKFALGGIATIAAPPTIRAQSKRFEGITLKANGFGGDYTRLLQKHVAEPLEKRTGLKVNYQSTTTSAAIAQLLATKGSAPPFDVLIADSPYIPELIKNGIVDKINPADVPNLKKVQPVFREFGDYGAAFLANAIILTYNSELVKTPITSYADLARPEFKGRLAFPSPQGTGGLLSLIALAESNGGGLDNMKPAFEVLKGLKQNIATVSPVTVTTVQFFEQGEVWAGPFWDGRIHAMRKAGRPLVPVVPKEGIYALYNNLNPIVGTKHPEAVAAVIDQVLSDEVVGAMSEFFRYSPCTDIVLPDAVRNDLIVSDKTRHLVKPVDWAKVSEQRYKLLEEFNRVLR